MVWLGLGLMALAGPVAQTIPFSNMFNYAVGKTVQSMTNEGWDASSPLVQVQTNVVYPDTASVILPQNTAMTNYVAPAAMTNVWTDFYVQMEPRNETNDLSADSNAVIQVALDWLGYLQVYDRTNGWLSLSNTVRGAPVTAFTNGQWGRVTLFQNYVAGQCAVFLNGTLLKELQPFGSNVTACSHVRVEGGDTTGSYFDNFIMTCTIPAGFADAQEIDTYGYVALTFNVGPGQTYTNIQSAIDAAMNRYTLNITSGTYNENVTITHSVIITGGVFTINNMTLGTNSTTTIRQGLSGSNLTLQAGAHLNVTGSVVAVSNLSINAGARLVVVNGTVVANGFTFTGSFTLDQNWGTPAAAAILPYQENFDVYQPGIPLNLLGFRGWGASDNSVVVEQTRYVSASNGVDLGYFKTLSNRVSAAGVGQVWTDMRVNPAYSANDDTTAVRSTAAFMMVVTTNGYLSFYDQTNSSWDVCTKDIWQNNVAQRTGQWSRVSVLCDYNTKKCAVFLDGVLLRQGLPFINPALGTNSGFSMANEETNVVSLDDVYVGATYPSTLTNDVNTNGIPDAQEILLTGDILHPEMGSIFTIR